MLCQDCYRKCRRHGTNRNGSQRFRCPRCKKTYSEEREPGIFGAMRVPEDRALMALHLLCEGSSVRAVCRVTGLHKGTVLKLLLNAGERCERLMAETIAGVPVKDVELDEVWSFVGCKERSKAASGTVDPERGDAYCFIALERTSKLVLAWHLGRRTDHDTRAFIRKLDHATTGRFQVSSDGFSAYPLAILMRLGHRTDYATLIKEYGTVDVEGMRRYSPAKLTGAARDRKHGSPKRERICTSYVERFNLSLRTGLRRWTRLTIAFSRCWRNHKAAVALFIAFYNFCTIHRSLRVTPAMAAGVSRRPLTIADLMRGTTHS